MEISQRIKAIAKLGKFLESAAANPDDAFLELVLKVKQHNGWFTEENVSLSISAWGKVLTEEKLEAWMSSYPEVAKVHPKRIGVIAAGNIPLVVFHDFLSVLMSGHCFVGKLSSTDNILLPAIVAKLIEIEPEFKDLIVLENGTLKNIDAVIATGSNNSSRYFEYYFGKYPSIIRKHRNSVAVLDGSETEEDLKALGNDIFQYFGLGCRNVSKLFVPQGYSFDDFFKAIFSLKEIINHNKYGNNYEYNRTLFLMHKASVLENGFLLLKEDSSMLSPVASLFYEYYSSKAVLAERLRVDKDNIQCVVGNKQVLPELIPFGQTQCPQLGDYADGIDTMKFLLKIN